MKKVVSIILCITLFLCSSTISFADNWTDGASPSSNIIQSVQIIDSSFLSNYDSSNIVIETTDLYSPIGNAVLSDIFYENTCVGYVISIDAIIYEFSEGPSPYRRYSSDDSLIFYYDYVNYGIENNELITYIDSTGNPFLSIDKKNKNVIHLTDMGYDRGILPGATINFQGSYNCIVAALANIMWYWGTNFNSNFIVNKTFDQIKAILTVMFNNNGGCSNNNVLSIANMYSTYCSTGVTFSGGAVWTNLPYTMITEINSGYPCMVGFAAGPGSYDPDIGHMTMCYGYTFTSQYQSYYIYLVDGHASNTVVKLWNSTFNDCTIRLH